MCIHLGVWSITLLLLYISMHLPLQFYCSGDCSFGMDIWQAGCSVLFMATGRRPWRHLCMDVDKQRAGPGIASLMKKRYCQMVSWCVRVSVCEWE